MSTPTIPQFTRDLFPTDGCQVGVMKLSDSQKTLINKVVSGEAFINPVQGAITDAQNSLSGALNFSINTLLGTTTEIVTDPDTGITSEQTVDVFGNINPLTYTGPGGYGRDDELQQALADAQNAINGMQVHTDRLSGVSMFDDSGSNFGVGGSSGEFGGIASLAGIASAYNNGKELLSDPGQALEDHFSPIFNSVLGPGNDSMGTLQTLMEGDVLEFIQEFPLGGNIGEITNQISSVAAGVQNLMDGDLNAYVGAVDYLAKQALGISVLDFYTDPCFLTKLMGSIGAPDVNALGQEIASQIGVDTDDTIAGADETLNL